MYGVVVTPPLNEMEIMYAVYVENKPLLFIKRIPSADRTKMTKQERKELDKVLHHTGMLFSTWQRTTTLFIKLRTCVDVELV